MSAAMKHTPAEALRDVRQWLGTDLFVEGDVHRERCRLSLALIASALPVAEAQEEAVKALQAFMPELDERERFIEYQDSPHTDEQRAMLRRISNARAALARTAP